MKKILVLLAVVCCAGVAFDLYAQCRRGEIMTDAGCVKPPKSPAAPSLADYSREVPFILSENPQPYLGNDTQAAPDDILNKVAQAKDGLIDLNKQAQKIDSPAGMQEMHQQFLNSLNNYVAAFQLTEEGLQSGDDAKFGQAGDLLMQGANQMQGVSQELLRLARQQKP